MCTHDDHNSSGVTIVDDDGKNNAAVGRHSRHELNGMSRSSLIDQVQMCERENQKLLQRIHQFQKSTNGKYLNAMPADDEELRRRISVREEQILSEQFDQVFKPSFQLKPR